MEFQPCLPRNPSKRTLRRTTKQKKEYARLHNLHQGLETSWNNLHIALISFTASNRNKETETTWEIIGFKDTETNQTHPIDNENNSNSQHYIPAQKLAPDITDPPDTISNP